MDQDWNEIVAEALASGLKTSTGPVPGAKLRQLIAKAARSRNLQYPPSGHEEESFGDFLKNFDSIVVVRRRPGMDLLAAPADKPELLGESQEAAVARLREDIFEAFTRIPRGVPPSEPWYRVSNDTIVWLLPTELAGSGELIKIPVATLDQELSERKSFIQSADLPQQAELRIAASLDTHSGLGTFSKLVKAYGLSQAWHRHRFQAVVRRIRAWCMSAGIPWHEEWVLSAGPSTLLPQSGSDLKSKDQRDKFMRFVESLTEEDLRRISIPLDIVLKVIKD